MNLNFSNKLSEHCEKSQIETCLNEYIFSGIAVPLYSYIQSKQLSNNE